MGRHRKVAPRHDGPVTLAFRAMSARPRRVPAFLLRIWPALPALTLLWPAIHGALVLYADAVLGYDAVLCLLMCLLVTPVITVARAPIAKLRWWYGNWVFTLGLAGLLVHLMDARGTVMDRMGGTPVDWTGTLIVALLLPMALTSSAVSQKLLGPEWKRWQRRLVWTVWAVVGIHLALLHSWTALAAYGGVSIPLLAIRHPRIRKSVKDWRAGGYSTGLWWAILAICVTVTATGLAILLTKEVQAVARPFT